MGLGSGIRDPGSGKKTYSESRIRVQGQKGTGSATLYHWDQPLLPGVLVVCVEPAGLAAVRHALRHRSRVPAITNSRIE
jgi:hypothetical protein